MIAQLRVNVGRRDLRPAEPPSDPAIPLHGDRLPFRPRHAYGRRRHVFLTRTFVGPLSHRPLPVAPLLTGLLLTGPPLTGLLLTVLLHTGLLLTSLPLTVLLTGLLLTGLLLTGLGRRRSRTSMSAPARLPNRPRICARVRPGGGHDRRFPSADTLLARKRRPRNATNLRVPQLT